MREAVTFTGTIIAAVAICSAVLLALAVSLYVRRRRFLQRGGFSEAIHEHYAKGGMVPEGQRDLLIMLLCYEERYPSFGAILAKIAHTFPLDYFSRYSEFGRAVETLVELSQDGADTKPRRLREHAALATIVRLAIDDPRIQQSYGRELEPLVDELIRQLQITR
ncbi:MAG: hypothetical protein HY315_02845 [Acidobacteria bacterium]|nr:hypothetical protein [Acidobacteriota bacterium]